MSEAIIVRGGKPVDTDAINASLLAMNTKIDNIDNKVDSAINEVNNSLGGTPTNSVIIANGYYLCTRTGNYWISLCGGGGGGYYYSYRSSARQSMTWVSGGTGFINSAIVQLINGENYYVTIGEGGRNTGDSSGSYNQGSTTGGTTSFGTLVAAVGGSSVYNPSNNLRSTGANAGWVYHYSDHTSWDYPEMEGNSFGAINRTMLFYYPNNRTLSATGSSRLYYGDGGGYVENGNSGCCIVTYID